MNQLAAHWTLDPEVDFLNHGSFGACPTSVLVEQRRLRDELERQPVEFLARRHEALFESARTELAAFVGARPRDLVAVTNATTGVNTVLASLGASPGDEVLVTDHGYNACRNALETFAERTGARIVEVPLPFPVTREEDVVDRVLAAVTPRTTLALLDHVTSPTALVLPLEELVPALEGRGVRTLVDGAHAPGMIELDLDALGASFYTGNGHKWLCAPKGAAFLHVREEHQSEIHPLVVSHGANTRREGRSLFHDEFDWTGTHDPTPFLCLPTALEALASMVDGGWMEVRARNRALALEARALLVDELGLEFACPDSMIGSIASLALPGEVPRQETPSTDPLVLELVREEQIEVVVSRWPALGQRILRISAQLYNSIEQYERLAGALSRRLT
ncbi:MAG: aminotransferase class V-fold PLP-dependent enzyme [Acidobacteriota bacterium]